MSTVNGITTFEHNGKHYKLPKHHYSSRVQDAVFFYGGWASNFVGGPFEIRDFDGLSYLDNPETEVAPHRSARDIAQSTHLREYETVEHYFAANKAATREEHDHIADQVGPWAAKKAGRKTALRPDWEEIKFNVMLTALRVKFAEPEFRDALMSTRDRFIAEDSPTDYVWGIRDGHGGFTGTNLLGKALMQVRDELHEVFA
jgi:ribA/ribD-fused uncharacterized protein